MSTELVKKNDVRTLMQTDKAKQQFDAILGKNSGAFMASVVQLSNSAALAACDPKSIISAAVIAASLNLSVDPSLGQAAIVPFKGKDGKSSAQFQIMYKGLIQLALRSGQVENINSCEVFDGELENFNKLTGKFDLTGSKKSDTVIGYAAYIRLINGFEKSIFVTKEDIEKHAKKYSKTFEFSTSVWKKEFGKMAEKTLLKMILKYSPVSTEMEAALRFDQKTVNTGENFDLHSDYEIANEIEDLPEDVIETATVNMPKA